MKAKRAHVPGDASTGTVAWWRRAVIYENHLPSFKDGNGDGVGDLLGLIQGLDYLAGTLGVDAVWVGPFYRSPLLDQGFDISDHTDVEPLFGKLDTFDRLITEAHDRGLKIIIDYVPNHTSDQHPWFLESRSSKTGPKRDWYLWADPAPRGGPPNNWTSEAGGSVWEWDEPTGQYYLHSHLREQPDLNWRNADVRKAMLDVLRFWLDHGADGVRIDVAHMLMKDPELRDNPANRNGEANPYDLQHADFHSQLHIYDRRHPDVHGLLREMRVVLDGYGDRLAIGEIEAMEWSSWAEFYGQKNDGLHLPFAFQLIETPWEPAALVRTIAELEAALPEGAWPILPLGNHDRRRLATRLGREQARVAAMLLLTLRGTPMIFYGDELGMVDQQVPHECQRDHFGLSAGGVSRDPTRTPMPWNSGPNGGFAPPSASELWLPISREYKTINAETQLSDPTSSLNLYRRLIAVRRHSPALCDGDYAGGGPRPESGCIVYERIRGDDRKLVALNLTGGEQRVALDVRGSVVCSTAADRTGPCPDDPLQLRPNEGVLIDVEQ